MLLGCGGWREAGNRDFQVTKLRLDFPTPIASAILHYAYTDALPAESRSVSQNFLCRDGPVPIPLSVYSLANTV